MGKVSQLEEEEHELNGQYSTDRALLHVIILPYPARGHSIPLLHFAKHLHSLGVTVTYVNVFNHLSKDVFDMVDINATEEEEEEEEEEKVDQDHSNRNRSKSRRRSIRVVQLGVPPVQTKPVRSLPYVREVDTLVEATEEMMEKLFAENQAAPPACLVSDMFLGWTQLVANKFNIPRWVLFASPCTALAAFLHIPELVIQGHLPHIEPSKDNFLVHDIPGVPPTRIIDLPSPIMDHTHYEYDFYLRNAAQMHEATGVLINTFYELEPHYIDVLRKTDHLLWILPVGPMLPSIYFMSSAAVSNGGATQNKNNDHPCLQWMEKQPPASVVFVSFGSVAALSIPQLHDLAMGLQESGQRFLLVVRRPAAAAASSGETMTEEDKDRLRRRVLEPLLPPEFTAHTEGRGFVQQDWAPQLSVLCHPAIGGFLTHCGWNSTLESICRGVPMLAWPIQAEQHMNCRFLVDDVKAAIEVQQSSDRRVTKAEVARAVKSLMTEDAGRVVRENVEKLRDLALKAVAKGGSWHLEANKLVNFWKTK
ncbi:unnamed protein product, partial [Sphagnum jensenii]